jgi:hypothetical protein
MAHSSAAPVSFTNQNFLSANEQAWTVPADPVSNKDVTMSVPPNDNDLPNYNEYPPPSAPDIGDLPPNYFDISIVPNNAVLHYNEVTPYNEASKADVERKKEGVLSFDPLIDKNPDQLWLYFMTYLNEKPSLGVNIHGYHIEVLYKSVQKNYMDLLFIALYHI